MRTLKIGLVLLALVGGSSALADTWVNGYSRDDGTYVQGHFRSDPNQYRFDNYSARGNTNPYTGERGYQRHEFTSPPAYNDSYGSGLNSNYGTGNGLYD